MYVIPIDVYDKEGNLLRIEFHNEAGDFEFQALWDENDEQTSTNREKFREWSYQMAKRQKFEILK